MDNPGYLREPFVPTARDEIIQKVRDGRLTPAQAEEEAATRGLPPFESEGAAADFDPMRETHWTLAMALAWIMWRSPDAVRMFWDKWRATRWRWEESHFRFGDGTEQKGHELRQQRPAHLSEVRDLGHFVYAGPLDLNGPAAQRQLLDALEGGDVVATGLEGGFGSRRPICGYEWLEVDTGFPDGDSGDNLRARGSEQPRFTSVRIERTAILKRWVEVPGRAKSGAEFRNGFAGRPSSRQLVEQEFDRLAELGELPASLSKTAHLLCDWLAINHPQAPQIRSPDSMKNTMRDRWRAYKSGGH